MKAPHNLQRWTLRTGGALVLTIAVGHAFLPTQGYPPSATQGMTEVAREHFFFLGTYAIGMFLLGMAVLAFLHSTRPGTTETLAFSAVMTLVWGIRLGLEFAYPVEVPIFTLDRPHTAIAPVLTVIATAFAVATLAGVAIRNRPRALRYYLSMRARPNMVGQRWTRRI